jgi:hypothetical protein
MKALRVLVAIIVMVAPASVYARGGGKRGKSDQTAAQKKPDDTEYQKALKSIPDQKPADPWARIR